MRAFIGDCAFHSLYEVPLRAFIGDITVLETCVHVRDNTVFTNMVAALILNSII